MIFRINLQIFRMLKHLKNLFQSSKMILVNKIMQSWVILICHISLR